MWSFVMLFCHYFWKKWALCSKITNPSSIVLLDHTVLLSLQWLNMNEKCRNSYCLTLNSEKIWQIKFSNMLLTAFHKFLHSSKVRWVLPMSIFIAIKSCSIENKLNIIQICSPLRKHCSLLYVPHAHKLWPWEK